MPDATWTPIIAVALTAVGAIEAFIFRTLISQGKDIVRLQTAFEYYLERTSRGTAKVLRKPNPTPPEMAELLRKRETQRLSSEERNKLLTWLGEVEDDKERTNGERAAAIQLAASIETIQRLHGRR